MNEAAPANGVVLDRRELVSAAAACAETAEAPGAFAEVVPAEVVPAEVVPPEVVVAEVALAEAALAEAALAEVALPKDALADVALADAVSSLPERSIEAPPLAARHADLSIHSSVLFKNLIDCL